MREFPIAAGMGVEERAGQLKPGKTSRRRATSLPRKFVRAEFNLPLPAGNLRGRQRERHFGELDEEIPIRIGRQQQIAGKFGAAGRRFPNGLALLDAPAGRGKIGGRERRPGTAAGDKDRHQ